MQLVWNTANVQLEAVLQPVFIKVKYIILCYKIF